MAELGGSAGGNTIHSLHYNVPLSWRSVGIMGFDTLQPGVVVENNEIYDVDDAINPSSGTIIRNNNLHNNGNGVVLEWGATDNQVIHNDITNNEHGIQINGALNPNPEGRDPPGTGNFAHNNKISGNTAGIVSYDNTQTFDAKNNWWGDASGPYHPTTNPFGTGDTVSDYVLYEPWLGKLEFDPSSSSIVTTGATATLKVRLTYLKYTSTTSFTEYPVPDVPVKFSSTPALTFSLSDTPTTGSDGYATVTTSSATAAVYFVTATVCGVISDTWTLVFYEPVGMAAGGGWYYPLADDESTMPGRASFGFIAKYIKGKSTGNLEFQYHANEGFNLKSITIDYLVVTGGKLAQFGGTATKDGQTGYYFRVKAIDNGEPGVGVDEFWIKIWEGDITAAETTDPFHSSHGKLAGGNIMVRNK